MRTDSTTLFKQARLEYKAAEAFAEEAHSALRLYDNMIERAEDTYLNALSLGVPAHIARAVSNETRRQAENVREGASESWKKSLTHRNRGRALMEKRDKQFRKELRVRFSG